MATLYLLPPRALQGEEDPACYFHFEQASPDDLAIGFIKIFEIYVRLLVVPDEAPDVHCIECALDLDNFLRYPELWKLDYGDGEAAGYVPVVLAEAALEMAIEVWDGTDWEAGATRARLVHHDIGRLVRVLATGEGAVGALATRLSARVDMTRTNGSSQQRRLTL